MSFTKQNKTLVETSEYLQNTDYNLENYCLVCKGKGKNFMERVCSFCKGNGLTNRSADLVYINHVCFCDKVDDGGYCPVCYLKCHSEHLYIC